MVDKVWSAFKSAKPNNFNAMTPVTTKATNNNPLYFPASQKSGTASLPFRLTSSSPPQRSCTEILLTYRRLYARSCACQCARNPRRKLELIIQGQGGSGLRVLTCTGSRGGGCANGLAACGIVRQHSTSNAKHRTGVSPHRR